MQTEKAKSSHFDRTRGFKNQIFPTLFPKPVTGQELFLAVSYSKPALAPFLYFAELVQTNSWAIQLEKLATRTVHSISA